jgi:hypothetical protein
LPFDQAPDPVAPPPPMPDFTRPVKLVLPFGTITHYPRGDFFAVCKNRGHDRCQKTGSSKRFGHLTGRPLAYLHAWLEKGADEHVIDGASHRWLVTVTHADRLASRDIFQANPEFADLLSCERQPDDGEPLESPNV